MKLILFGKPVAGKGTQAKKLIKEFNVKHVSTGDLFRAEVAKGTGLGKKLQEYMTKGVLVPDEITIEILKHNLPESFILDGFPRNVEQAKQLDTITNIDLVIDVHCPDELLIKRVVLRKICKSCGAIHGINTPPKVEGVCNECGGELYQRDEDNEETIKGRLDVYNKQTKPVLNYYKEKGKLVEIDGDRTPEPIFEEILNILKEKGLNS